MASKLLALLTAMQKLRIRARSGVAEETLNAYLADPRRVRAASAMRIEDAARAEGISLARCDAPKPSTSTSSAPSAA